MNEHLDKIREKIAAIKAKTEGTGCTEAEALAAAETVARLMAEHGLTDADIDMTTARVRERTVRATWRTPLVTRIARVTNTAAVLIPHEEQIEFLGRAPWPEIAAYLYQVLVRAVDREATAFKVTGAYKRRRTTKTRRIAVADFIDAMVTRLRMRLNDLFAKTVNDEAGQEARNALAARHGPTETMKPPVRQPRYHDAIGAGWQAGGNVTLAHGVAGPDGRPLAIEHKS